MNLVAPFGFFGAGNIGDESTLQGFARLVSPYRSGTRFWVASRNPSHTARVEPSFSYYNALGRDLRRPWAKYRSAAHVFIGGTPIMDVLGTWPLSEVVPLIVSAGRRRRPVAFVGAGTETLQRPESRRLIRELVAPRVRHWSVRSERDRDRLSSYGVEPQRITVAADLAWLLDPVSTDFGKRCLARLGLSVNGPLVGVNLTNEAFALDQQPGLFQKVAAFLDTLVEKYDARILFLANEVRADETFDQVASHKVLAQMSHPDKATVFPNKYWTPQEMLSLIGCCHMTLSMRYHFCLFSALQNVPFIALKRSDKVDDLCWDLNWQYGLSLGDLSLPTMVDMFSQLDEHRPSLTQSLPQQVQWMRQRALKNNRALDVLLQHE